MSDAKLDPGMIVVGLTGSIGMGKSTVAQMFRDAGVPVFDADAAVHELYAPGGAAVMPVARRFPDAATTSATGDAIDRAELSRAVLGDAAALAALEAIVHPLVRDLENGFLAAARDAGEACAVLEIPLLFETGGEARVDVTIVVSAPGSVQRARVLERPGMTRDKLASILARQTPDADKRARADFVVDTGASLADTRDRVAAIIAELGRRARMSMERGDARDRP